MRTTPAVPAADMSDNTLLLNLITADECSARTHHPPPPSGGPEYSPRPRHGGHIDATERSASGEVRHHASGAGGC